MFNDLLLWLSELRGFAPIGILEYWNVGMMGLNEFYRFYKKDFFRFYTQYSIIPSFHYSMSHCNGEQQL
jgi:hypothetical protein